MANVLVLSVNRWEMKDEVTGVPFAGTTITYIGEPSQPKKDFSGSSPMKMTIPVEDFSVFSKVPAYYDIAFDVVPGPGGKPKVAYVGAQFVSPILLDFTGKPKAANA